MKHANAVIKPAHKRRQTKTVSQLPPVRETGYLIRKPEMDARTHIRLELTQELPPEEPLYAAFARAYEQERFVLEALWCSCDPEEDIQRMYGISQEHADALVWKAHI